MIIKSRLKKYWPKREEELKEKGRKNNKILKQRLIISGNKHIEKEIGENKLIVLKLTTKMEFYL